jgi:hypothetical protein
MMYLRLGFEDRLSIHCGPTFVVSHISRKTSEMWATRQTGSRPVQVCGVQSTLLERIRSGMSALDWFMGAGRRSDRDQPDINRDE